MIKAATVLKEMGAAEISAICVHPLLVGDAVTNLKKAGIDRIYGSDTISNKHSGYSIALDVAEALRQ